MKVHLFKRLTRKPPLIILFSALYALNPVGNFLLLVFAGHVSAGRVLTHLYNSVFLEPNGFVIFTLSLWLSGVILAYGLFRVRLWAWYGFIIHSVLSIVASLYQSTNTFAMTTAFFVNLISLIPLGYFIRKEIRKPYFHPRLRWWEQHPRLLASIRAELTWNEYSFKEKTFDLAPDGIFVQTELLDDIAVGYFFNIVLYFSDGNSGERRLEVQGIVVWIQFEAGTIPKGYGIKFLGISRANRDFIGQYINKHIKASPELKVIPGMMK